MRIIAGKRRGLKLLPPKTAGTRPITDRVKESLFSVLLNTYGLPDDKNVADIFCGTGSLGMEAVSRGAKFTLFIERDSKVIDVLRKNIERAQFVEETKIIRGNAFKMGSPVEDENSLFDLVFVDPPYRLSRETSPGSNLGGLMKLLNYQIATGGMAVVRTEDFIELPDEYGSLKAIDRRKWGSMRIVLYENQPAETINEDENLD